MAVYRVNLDALYTKMEEIRKEMEEIRKEMAEIREEINQIKSIASAVAAAAGSSANAAISEALRKLCDHWMHCCLDFENVTYQLCHLYGRAAVPELRRRRHNFTAGAHRGLASACDRCADVDNLETMVLLDRVLTRNLNCVRTASAF